MHHHVGRTVRVAAISAIAAVLPACTPGSAGPRTSTAPATPSASVGTRADGPTDSTPTATSAVRGTGLTPEVLPITPRTASVAVAPPATFDLTPWAPPPGDQGSVGSCVAWSIAYTAMGYYQRHDGIGGGALAPMFTYAQLAQGRDTGSTFSGNLGIATTQGVDTKSDYVPQGDFDFTTQPTAAQRTNAAAWKLSGYRTLAIDQVAIESSIASGHPVAIGIPVYGNFFSVSAANRGFYASASGSFAGYHAVTALGYDTTGLRIENSWGAGWGDRGFATLSWDFVRSSVFSAIEIGPFAPGAPTTTPTTTPTSIPPNTTTTTTRAPVTTTTVRPTTTTTAAPALPIVTSVSPAAGPLSGGQSVTLTGTGLAGATAVTVGGRAAGGLVANAAGTSLRILVPAGVPGSAPIIVTGRTGVSRASAAAVYRYIAPTVTGLSPTTGPVAGGSRVTITGANLQGARIGFGASAPVATVAANGTSLTFTTPALGRAAAIPVTIIVGSTTVAAGTFTAR